MVKKGTVMSADTRKKMSDAHKGKAFSEDHKRNIGNALRGIKRSEETRRRISENHADMSGENNPRFGTHCSDETRHKISKANAGKRPSEETKAKRAASIRGQKRTDEQKKRLSLALMGHQVSPETRIILAEAARGAVPSEETKRKMSLANIGNKRRLGIKHSEETKRRLSVSHRLEKNAAWKGGISFEDYCPKFNKKLKEEIREKFDRNCFLCGVPENGEKLCVHHVDYNKGQGCGQRWTLVPLCHSCHAKTGHRRYYYFNLLNVHWLKFDVFESMAGF